METVLGIIIWIGIIILAGFLIIKIVLPAIGTFFAWLGSKLAAFFFEYILPILLFCLAVYLIFRLIRWLIDVLSDIEWPQKSDGRFSTTTTAEYEYVLNTRTKVIHWFRDPSVETISQSNRVPITRAQAMELVRQNKGYRFKDD